MSAAAGGSPQLPPIESPFLIGDTDPVVGATERRRQRPRGQFRAVILLAQVGGDQMLQAPGIDLAQKRRRLLVLQMAKATADTLLERRGICLLYTSRCV